jgi:DNA-binding NarL/FixJ family response regulator
VLWQRRQSKRDRAAALSPDVVLMDIRLAAGSSSIDAAQELHARQALRCIFLSANLDEAAKTALRPYDPIDFVGSLCCRSGCSEP